MMEVKISAKQEAGPVLRATVGLACSRYAPVGISAPIILQHLSSVLGHLEITAMHCL